MHEGLAAVLMDNLRRLGNPDDAVQQARYHKAEREYLGVRLPDINRLAGNTGRTRPEAEVIEAVPVLWGSDVHEARILVGKLLEQKGVTDMGAVWACIRGCKEDFDAWAIADAQAHAAWRCLQADPVRLDRVEEEWLPHPSFWVRRAALVYTLYLAKAGQNPERPLAWAAQLVPEREWFIQKAIGWWLRELSRHDPGRVREFLAEHGEGMKAFARREASKYL